LLEIKFKFKYKMGNDQSKYTPVSQDVERPKPKTKLCPEYMPIESFFYKVTDNDLVCWIMDNIGVLRSIFKIQQLSTDRTKSINFGGNDYSLSYEKGKWQIESTLSIANQTHNKDTYIFHFIDGTAAMIYKGDLYYLHFEECPDRVFEDMKKERKLRDRETIRRGKISQKVYEQSTTQKDDTKAPHKTAEKDGTKDPHKTAEEDNTKSAEKDNKTPHKTAEEDNTKSAEKDNKTPHKTGEKDNKAPHKTTKKDDAKVSHTQKDTKYTKRGEGLRFRNKSGHRKRGDSDEEPYIFTEKSQNKHGSMSVKAKPFMPRTGKNEPVISYDKENTEKLEPVTSTK
jgi:hypothetical protein